MLDQTPEIGGVEIALARNAVFATAGGHVGATVLPALRLFVVTCLDPRVDPAHILGLELGDAMVVRNGGGRVTPEVVRHIAFICQLAEGLVPEGPLFEIAVIHHTQCGSGALADDGFRDRFARRIGVEESTLRATAVVDPMSTVKLDVEKLAAEAAISPRVTISGYVYDVTTGVVERSA